MQQVKMQHTDSSAKFKKKWNRKANSKLAMTFIYDKEEILQYYNSVV